MHHLIYLLRPWAHFRSPDIRVYDVISLGSLCQCKFSAFPGPLFCGFDSTSDYLVSFGSFSFPEKTSTLSLLECTHSTVSATSGLAWSAVCASRLFLFFRYRIFLSDRVDSCHCPTHLSGLHRNLGNLVQYFASHSCVKRTAPVLTVAVAIATLDKPGLACHKLSASLIYIFIHVYLCAI